LEARYPGLRPVLQSDLLTALIRAISAQQVNLQWATTTRRRLAETFGCQHRLGSHQVFSLAAARPAAVYVMALRALQLTTRKAEYIVALATAVATGTLDLAALHDQPDAEVIACLTACWPRTVDSGVVSRSRPGTAACSRWRPGRPQSRRCS